METTEDETLDLSAREDISQPLNVCRQPWRNLNRCNGMVPVSKYEWRIGGELLPATSEYHRKLHVDYIPQNLIDIVEAGNVLVQKAGNLDNAMCQFQEHEFRKMLDQHQYVLGKAQWIPAVDEEMDEVLRIWVAASYTRPHPTAPRRRGLPYRAEDTEEILRKLRSAIKGSYLFLRTECDRRR